MKKILFAILAAACTFAACTKFASESTPELGTVSVPVISDVQFDDYTLTATVTPAEGTAFYGYAIVEGAGEVNPTTLLSGKVSGALVGKSVNAEKESSVTFTASGLNPNTTYTVYAVASNKQGVKSEVVSVTKTTSDSTYPALSGYDTEVDGSEMVIWVGFNENVTLTGAGAVTAFFYAINDEADEDGYIEPAYEVNIDLSILVTDGKWLGIPIPEDEYQPGAYVFINYTAGVVKNDVGLENVAYSNRVFSSKGPVKGICEQWDTVDWGLMLGELGINYDKMCYEIQAFEQTPVIFSEWDNFMFMIGPDADAVERGIEVAAEDLSYHVTYTQSSGRTVSYDTDPYMNFALCAEYMGLTGAAGNLDEAPEFGASVSIEIEAGCAEDRWGNANEALSEEDIFFCSYGYTLDDFCGTYTFSGESYWGGTVTDTIEIAASDDPDYDVMLTGTIAEAEIQYPVYGYVDLDSGILQLENFSDYYWSPSQYEGYDLVLELLDYNDQESDLFTLSHPTATTYSTDHWIGVYQYLLDADYNVGASGWYELFVGWYGRKSGGSMPITPITTSVRPSFPANFQHEKPGTTLERMK